MIRPLSVSQVAARTSQSLQAQEPVSVVGELSTWTSWKSGHTYFTIRDDRAQMRGMLHRSQWKSHHADLETGTQVLVRGAVALYAAQGVLQIQARDLRALDERGLWRRRLERVEAALQAEGLFIPGRQRRLPRLPSRIGIVTSSRGAALQDVIAVLRRRYPCVQVLVADTRVQGRRAEHEIAAAIERITGSGAVDVVLVTRGGGSTEDLWDFNEEMVARAICGSPVPVVAAIGHETDLTLAERVADLRAPTPSAGAELLVPDAAGVRAALAQGLRERTAVMHGILSKRAEMCARIGIDLGTGLQAALAFTQRRLFECRPEAMAMRLRSGVDVVDQRVASVRPSRLLPHVESVLRFSAERARACSPDALAACVRRLVEERRRATESVGVAPLHGIIAQRIDRAGAQLDRITAELFALSPRATIERGYAIPLDRQGRVIRSASQVAPGDLITVHVADGVLSAKVANRIHPHTEAR